MRHDHQHEPVTDELRLVRGTCRRTLATSSNCLNPSSKSYRGRRESGGAAGAISAHWMVIILFDPFWDVALPYHADPHGTRVC